MGGGGSSSYVLLRTHKKIAKKMQAKNLQKAREGVQGFFNGWTQKGKEREGLAKQLDYAYFTGLNILGAR